MAINLFTHFVVYESGKSVDNMLTFIKECLLEYMNKEEKTAFFRKAIEKFLYKPDKNISQKAVI